MTARLVMLVALLASVAVAADEPPVVTYLTPTVRPGPDALVVAGRAEATSTVEVRARVTGYLDKVHVEDGAEVKQGDLLFEIDARPYRAELARAEAQLAASLARLTRADADLKRLKALDAAVSRAELDRGVAVQAEAQAEVEAAKAAVELAKLHLGFTRITAPINGRIGRRLLDVGNLVRADETALAVLAEDGIRVAFDVDERTLLRFRRANRDRITVGVGLSDEADFPRAGKVDFIDTRLDEKAGTLRMRATLEDPKRLLLPGMFVRVRLALPDAAKPQVFIQRRALVTDGPDWKRGFVYLVGEGDRIEKRNVVIGRPIPRTGDITALVPIDQGLGEKDRVVLDPEARSTPPVGTVATPKAESK